MQNTPQPEASRDPAVRTGLARALSKLGFCSRSQAVELIRAGRVTVDGRRCTDPECRIGMGQQRVRVDGRTVEAERKVYLALNKPRGLVSTRSDEKGRPTVCGLLAGRDLPMVMPVGRLDQASEGLLLFTNDTAWAARLTDPASHVQKVYAVQVDCLAEDELLRRMIEGVESEGDFLNAKRAAVLRRGTRNSWIEVVLDEGKNRHLRRLLAGLGVEVLRLIRVAIGPLELGPLRKGEFRALTPTEVEALARADAQSHGGRNQN